MAIRRLQLSKKQCDDHLGAHWMGTASNGYCMDGAKHQPEDSLNPWPQDTPRPFGGVGACCCGGDCLSSNKTYAECESHCRSYGRASCWQKDKGCLEINCPPTKDDDCPDRNRSCCIDGVCVNLGLGNGRQAEIECAGRGGSWMGYGGCSTETCIVQQEERSSRGNQYNNLLNTSSRGRARNQSHWEEMTDRNYNSNSGSIKRDKPTIDSRALGSCCFMSITGRWTCVEDKPYWECAGDRLFGNYCWKQGGTCNSPGCHCNGNIGDWNGNSNSCCTYHEVTPVENTRGTTNKNSMMAGTCTCVNMSNKPHTCIDVANSRDCNASNDEWCQSSYSTCADWARANPGTSRLNKGY
jgi:hypothetical protein